MQRSFIHDCWKVGRKVINNVKKPDFSISQPYSIQIEHHQNLSSELQVLQGQQALPTMCEICLEV